MTAPETPARVSWSMLRAHETCHQKSYLIRSGRRSKAQNLRVFFGGMVVDRAMMRWLSDLDRQPGQMLASIDEMIEVVAADAVENGDGVVHWKGADDRRHVRDFCRELVTRLEPILDTLVTPYEFEPAKRFKVPVTVPYLDGTPTTIILSGEMDLLVRNDGWVVWDLKGTKDDDYYKKVLGQLIFYDLATMCLHRAKTRKVGLIQPMCREPVREWAVTDDARNTMWSRVLRYVEDIWRNEHTVKKSTKDCTWCEVKHACERYQPDSLAAGLHLAAHQEHTHG
jgi:hypothetical protein